MNPAVYAALCSRTECDQDAARIRMYGAPAGDSCSIYLPVRLNHSVVGMAGEVGELASILQKLVYYGKPLTSEVRNHLLEEYGDVLWYVAEGLNALGADMGHVMETNIRKLKARFPEKYTDYHVAEENRDRDKETEAMVSATKETEVQANIKRDNLRARLEADRTRSGDALAEKLRLIEEDRLRRMLQQQQRIVQDGHGFGHVEHCEGDGY